ncbi:MAG TPA: GWxTD domain-containing protein [Bacteroidetes bacterium]|nr:GWxTD domain-containing protein [Bacteroidota bacterium]
MRHALLLAAVLTIAACGGARLPGGSATTYTPGLPDFDLGAVPYLDSNGSGVEALVSIPRASLVFRRDSSGFLAVARTTLSLRGGEGRPDAAPSRVDTLRVATFEETVQLDPLIVRERLAVSPGRYQLLAEVEDGSTRRRALRAVEVEVPAPASEPMLSAVRLEGVPAGRRAFAPIVSLGVPAELDSFRVRFDVFNASGALDVDARLLRLRADTSIARPPSGFTESRVSLISRGVDARDPDTVFVSRQRVPAPDRSLTVEQALPGLSPGVFALSLTATDVVSGALVGDARRTFVVRPPGFPRLQGIEDFVGPLSYLATPREYAELTAVSPDSLRQSFDAFWGTLFRDRRLAAATFRAFYERVEEANRLFSTHKEGWKTDRGMVYVLFGPPERTETRFQTEVWVYGPGQAIGEVVFERVDRRQSGDSPYDVYLLSRDQGYDAAWRRALRQWRSGQAP